jgi:hypothetical protein
MPPETTVTVSYGISKAPDVMQLLSKQTALFRDRINAAIDSLQSNPRPAGVIEDTFGPATVFKVVVDDTRPPILIAYFVDETKGRVHIIALSEKRWS